MANGFGVNFLPGAEPQNGMAGRSGATRPSVQEAVQILSLRLPKVFGARAVIPQQLATAPGGMGMPGARPGANAQAQALAGLAGVPMPQSPLPSKTLPGGLSPGPMLPPPQQVSRSPAGTTYQGQIDAPMPGMPPPNGQMTPEALIAELLKQMQSGAYGNIPGLTPQGEIDTYTYGGTIPVGYEGLSDPTSPTGSGSDSGYTGSMYTGGQFLPPPSPPAPKVQVEVPRYDDDYGTDFA